MNSRAAKVGKTQDDDRISALPDSLLCHILSFLPTKYAVATAILSTRWKYLFTSLPNLDFNDRLLLHPENGIIDVHSFTNFVYRVLLLRSTPCLNSFHLNCYARYDNSHVNAWICAVLWRNVKELDISVNVDGFGMLPRAIFTCRTLVVLKLAGNFNLDVHLSVCLPNLKVLDLTFIKFTDDDSIRSFFSGFPVLEELELFRCKLGNVQILDISIPLLKSLTLCICGDNHQIMLNAPILEYFKYSDFETRGCLVKDLTSLVNAHLNVGLSDEQVEEDSLHYGHYVSDLVNEISRIKFLHLSGQTLEAIDYSDCSLPIFHNLIHLVLGVNLINGWQLLPNLLESSPNLEVLVFVKGFMNYSADEWTFHYRLPQSAPTCLSRCLKEIEIGEFGGEEDELKLIEYFLNNGEVLKKITINMGIFVEWPSCIRQRILMFPRCSKTCQIVLERPR